MEHKIDYEYLIHSHNCAGYSKICDCRMSCAECIRLDFIACGIGDIKEFAVFLKDYARQVKENGYDGIGENDIDEKLKEFLNNEVS